MYFSPQAKIVIFFAITQILGIFTGIMLLQAAMANEIVKEISVAPLDSNDPMNALIFLLYIIAGASIVLLAARLFKGKIFFRLLETSVIASASSIVFFAFGVFLGLDIFLAIGFGILLGVFFAVAKFLLGSLKNWAAIISSAGVAAIFGYSLGFIPIILFVLLLSLYDYIAVFKTKHMVEMAKELSSRQLSFVVTANKIPSKKPNEKTEDYIKRAMSEGERLDLGTGDLSVPAMMSVSAYSLGPNGFTYSIAIALGATISIYFLLSFVAKRRVFLPALPPICLGGMLSFLAIRLLGF